MSIHYMSVCVRSKPVTYLFSCVDTSFMHEKSFNVTGLFRNHVTKQFVFAQLSRVKHMFIITCDYVPYVSSFVLSLVSKQNMVRIMSRKNGFFPGWALRNKSIYPQTQKVNITIHVHCVHYSNMHAHRLFEMVYAKWNVRC